VEDELRQGVSKAEARSGPIGMAFRVPMIVASPWSRGGWVNSQVFDHTSTLTFLERFVQQKYGKTVREENISEWRRTVTGDLTSVFRPYDPKQAALDFLNRDKQVVSIARAREKELPSSYRKLTAAEIASIHESPRHSALLPHQEPGIKPACALPYELYADGGLHADGKSFEVRLSAGNQVHGAKSAGAPFNLYVRNKEGMTAATYAVTAGDSLSRQLPLAMFADGNYELEVHGPNGFYRSFTGRSEATRVGLQTAYERQGDSLTGNLQIRLHNAGDTPASIEIKDNAYKAAPITKKLEARQDASLVLPLKKSHGWYDFTISMGGAETRVAGRVEAGNAGFTDPFMGGVV
jgi:phospholipase C